MHFVTSVSILVVLAFSVHGGAPAKRLGFYTCVTPQVGNQCEEGFTLDQLGIANTGFSSNWTTIARGGHNGVSTFFAVHDTFFENGKGLWADWATRWAALRSKVEPFVANGTVIGFFVGDELFPGKITVTDFMTCLRALADMKRQYPTLLTWENEGGLSWINDFNETGIPEELDIISLDDYYLWNKSEGDSPQSQVDGHREFYESKLYPLLKPHQKVFLVPGSFATHDTRGPIKPNYPSGNKTYCYNGTFEGCDKYMTDQANAFAAWALEDPRVAGIFPWHWDSRSIGVVTPFKEVGIADMPRTRSAWKTIARKFEPGQRPYMGFIGPYHATNGSTVSGQAVNAAFRFGHTAVQNAAADGGWLLKDDLQWHAQTDALGVTFMLLPPSEGGVVNNPLDNNTFRPASNPGLVQGAHRFSKISQSGLLNSSNGIVIDDFLQNYRGNTSGPCAKCPVDRPYPYGDSWSGEFCCSHAVNNTGHCASSPACCIRPGVAKQCQGVARCGTNPSGRPACGIGPARGITLADLMQIKGALLGKTVDPFTGFVDFTSPSKTPHLKLYIVWYTRFTPYYIESGLLSGTLDSGEPIVDGVSLWIEGPDQSSQHSQWTSDYKQLRTLTSRIRSDAGLPRLAVWGGSYIEHSHTGILEPGPFESMLSQSIDLYDHGELEGFWIFAGTSIPKLNSSMWQKWDLEGMLDRLYQPWLGRACGTFSPPFSDRRIEVTYESNRVTSKLPNANGRVCFEGWAGKERRIPHRVQILDEKGMSVDGESADVQIVPGQTVFFTYP